MTNPKTTLAEMIEAQEQVVFFLEGASGRPRPKLRATATLLRTLADPSDEAIDGMMTVIEQVRENFALGGCMESIAINERDALRASLSALVEEAKS